MPFIGRQVELDRLQSLVSEAADGRPQMVLVCGDAGVGKTRLIEELSAQVQREGVQTLTGACLDVEEGRLPFGPFVEALRQGLSALDVSERPGGETGELGRLIPELHLSGAAPEVPTLQVRLFELLLVLIGKLALTAPLLLVIEDLHWADRSTRDLLAFTARNLRHERVMLVATYRSDDLYRGHPLRAFLAELQRRPAITAIEVPPFERREVAELIAAIAGGTPDPRVVDAVFARSSGNAFYAEELARTEGPRTELPRSLKDIILGRLDRLSPAAFELLRVIAVAGRAVSDKLLAAVCPWPEAQRLASLREAVAQHVLVSRHAAGYGFRHELLRETVYDDLLPGERSRLHAAYATALHADPALALDRQTVESDLARHWFAAHDLPRALSAAMAAAKVAGDHGGFAEAQMHYGRVLELWRLVPDAESRAGLDRIGVTRCAAESANLVGEHATAAALIRGVIDDLEPDADPGLVATLWERFGRYLWAAGDSETAVTAYDEAVRLAAELPASPARARVLAARAQALMLLGRYEASRAVSEEAIAVARQVGARAHEGHALNTLGCDLAYLGSFEPAERYLREALSVAEEVDDLDDLGRAYLNLSDVLIGPLNRLEDGLAVAVEGARRAQSRGMAEDYGVSLECNAASALLALGRLDEARRVVVQAEDRRPTEMAGIDLHRCCARVELWSGRFAETASHAERAWELMAKTVDPAYVSTLHAIEAELALWQRQLPAAHSAVTAGLEVLGEPGDPWQAAPLLWLGLWACADDVLVPRGRVGADSGLRVQLQSRTRGLRDGGAFLAPAVVAYLALAEAEAARLTGEAVDAPWRRAATAWEALGHPYLEAYALWRLAEALLSRRRGRDGAQVLSRAHRVSAGIGAEHLAEQVRLLAMRGRIDLTFVQDKNAPQPETPKNSGLTPRQAEVLRLLAAGFTNREIARALFITEKTAGAHVSSILAALGVRSRVEAATVAHRMGIVDSPHHDRAANAAPTK